MRLLSLLIVLHAALVLGSCSSDDFPSPPNLQPVLQAYENPTATVTSDIMAAVADEIAAAAEEIEDSEIFEEILDLIIDVQEELANVTARTCSGGSNNGKTCTEDAQCPDGACEGDTSLVLGGVCSGGTNEGGDCAADGDCPGGTCSGGVTLPSPTGAFRINYICPGLDVTQFDPDYEADPDSANGSIELFMTLDGGGIGRVVWGTAKQCLYLVPLEGDDCEAGCSEASFDGGVALDLGEDWVNEDIESLPVTFVVEGTIGLDGDDFRINQSFRVILAVESGLDILVDIGDPALTETFNYIFAGDLQGVRDATGFFGCSLEDSQCFEQTCEGGANDGRVCTTDADCSEGTCERRELFSW